MPEPTSGYILAIDAGQTSTSCLIGLQDGTLLSSGKGGAAAVPNAERTAPMMRFALAESVNEALEAISPRPSRLSAAYLSLTGGTGVALEFLPSLIPVDHLKAESDSVAALASGAFGGPGVALISGTGCVTFAQNAQGKQVICGGWGFLLGDEGSGYWIGLQAVKAANKAQDGRCKQSPLTELVLEKLGVTDMREAQAKIYNDQISRPQIAELARLVMDQAHAGDPLACAIADQAASELFLLVKATCLKAGFSAPDEKVIVVTGGVMHPETPVYRKFVELAARDLPDYRVVSPHFPPVVGAYFLALQLIEVPITVEVIGRIATTLARLPAGHLKK